jgi:hypothetical protein
VDITFLMEGVMYGDDDNGGTQRKGKVDERIPKGRACQVFSAPSGKGEVCDERDWITVSVPGLF